jgi:hypothetical protein
MGAIDWPSMGTIFWTAIVFIVWIGNYFNYKRRASRDRALEKLVEHGQSLPPSAMPELLASLREQDDGNPFTVGFVLIGIGVALALFFWAMAGGGGLFAGEPDVPKWLPAVGLFPFVVGIAKLLGTVADRRSEWDRK